MPGFAPEERSAAGMGVCPVQFVFIWRLSKQMQNRERHCWAVVPGPAPPPLGTSSSDVSAPGEEEQSPAKGGGIGVMLALPIRSVPSARVWALLPLLPA